MGYWRIVRRLYFFSLHKENCKWLFSILDQVCFSSSVIDRAYFKSYGSSTHVGTN